MMWNETLQCGWLMWIAEGERELMLMVPEGHRPDMTGCIRLASALMPEVRTVKVYDKGDQTALVAHYDQQHGAWVALPVQGRIA